MQTDPVIKRVCEIRHKISENFEHNPKKYIEYLKKEEKKYKNRIVKETTIVKKNLLLPDFVELCIRIF